MAEKNESTQLSWVLPQQPGVQTIVLQQPSKTHMELNASTDKTAISSFALSVLIALVLGGFATWLAYWYGRKSFDLTKESFDAVIAQIKSSEKLMLNSNRDLIKSQNEMMVKNQKISYILSSHEKLKREAVTYIVLHQQYGLYFLILDQQLRGFVFSATSQSGTSEYEYILEIRNKILELNSARSKLLFELNSVFNQDELTDLIKILNEVQKICLELKTLLISNNKNEIVEKCKTLQNQIDMVSFSINETLKEDSILNIELTKPA